MNTATIVVKKPGLYVPDDLLNTVSSRCPTAFGFGGRAEGKLVYEISPRSIALPELKQLQEAFKDEWLVMYFANFPKAELPDDCQPWSINGADGEPLALLFAEGTFKKYEGLSGNHTGEFCASDEAWFPRISKAMVDADNDEAKFFEELRKDNFQRSLKNTFDDRGVFVFLPKAGEAIRFGESNIGGSFDWGSTSNLHGYVAKVVAAPVKEAAKPGLAFLRGGGTPAPAKTPDIEVSVTEKEPVAEPSGGEAVRSKEVTGINPAIVGKTDAQLEAAGWRKTFPPPKLAKGKARNYWLRVFNGGHLPPNHESAQCSVWVAPDIIDLSSRTASSKGEVENIAYQVNKRRKEAAGSGIVTPIEQKAIAEASAAAEILTKKDDKPITSGKSTVREKHVPSGTPSANTSPYLPTMTDDEKLKAMEVMDEYFKKDKQPTPLEIQKGESKHATFSSATGYKFTDLLFLPVEQIYKLFDGNKIAVASFVEMRRNYLDKTDLKLEDLVISTKVEKEEKKEEPKTSVPEVQPKKNNSALAFLRKAG
jgi:hypothetical protein